jgi:hypothetical protein
MFNCKGKSHQPYWHARRRRPCLRSVAGQKRKWLSLNGMSVSALNNGHAATATACRLSARGGHAVKSHRWLCDTSAAPRGLQKRELQRKL